jgi:hypothetical protein
MSVCCINARISSAKIRSMSNSTELPTLTFESKKKFADWLAKNHDKSAGLWLKVAKKATGISTVTYAEDGLVHQGRFEEGAESFGLPAKGGKKRTM